MLMRFVLLVSVLFFVGCSSNPEKIYKLAPKTPEYNVQVIWANKFADIGVDKFSRLVPAVTQSTIVMADTQGQLYHFDKLTGKLIWKKSFNARFSGGPLISGEMTIKSCSTIVSISMSNKAFLSLFKVINWPFLASSEA